MLLDGGLIAPKISWHRAGRGRSRFATSDVANLWPPSRVGQEERAEVAQIRGREATSKSRPEAPRKLVDHLLAVVSTRVTLLQALHDFAADVPVGPIGLPLARKVACDCGAHLLQPGPPLGGGACHDHPEGLPLDVRDAAQAEDAILPDPLQRIAENAGLCCRTRSPTLRESCGTSTV